MWRTQHARAHSDAVKERPGGVDSWGRGDALLAHVDLELPACAAADVYVRRLANRHDCPGRCDRPEHYGDAVAAGDVLLALGLREPPAGEPPPPPPPPITTELWEAAEAYLDEHANGGTYGLYERLAKRLVPDGCDDPVRYLRNLLSSCRRHGWLITNDKGHASLPGPLLEQARREGEWDGC